MKFQLKLQKNGKVTAVVRVISIFCKRSVSCGVLFWETRSFLAKKAESVKFLEGNFHGPRDLSLKMRKGRLPKKLAPKSKILELNSTNLERTAKKHA